MGPQGSGKGTVGSMLSEHLDFPLISVGQLLRDLPEEHPFYTDIHSAMEAGELAPSKVVASIIKERVSKSDCKEGYILDGWCRRMDQMNYFDPSPNLILVLAISRETSIKRITGRRICTSNGKTYNIYTLPEQELEECTGDLIQRADDTEEAVKERLNIYYTETKEVIDHYAEKGLVEKVDAEGSPEEVFQNAMAVLREKFSIS